MGKLGRALLLALKLFPEIALDVRGGRPCTGEVKGLR